MSTKITVSPYRHIELISYAAAALGIEMVWATAIGFLPPMLERLGGTPRSIGLLMSIGPITGMIVQPLIGLWSDRAQSQLGRRLPFLLFGAPIAFAGLLALGSATSLIMAAIFLLMVCLAVNGYQGPYRAILGDEIAEQQHTLASSFMNLFGGIGMLSAFSLGAILIKYHDGLPFFVTAIMVLLTSSWTLLVMRRLISGSDNHDRQQSTDQIGLWQYFKSARNLHWLFAAQFCWWFAIQAASAFAVLFTVHEIKGIADISSPAGRAAASESVLLLAVVTITVLIMAVPAALLAQKIGKKQVLSIGLAIMVPALFITSRATTSLEAYLAMVMFGIGFATVQVIPFTIITELQPPGREGVLAGIFNLFIALPQLVSLMIVGEIIQRTGSYRSAFTAGGISILLALIILQKVRLKK